MKTTEEKNRMIAEFMGADLGFEDEEFARIIFEGYWKTLKYHSSWDWLMPVVRKFAEIYNEHPQRMYYEVGNIVEDLQIHLFQVEIEDTYNTVLKFIKWYNQNK